jgi:hypothetical protein
VKVGHSSFAFVIWRNEPSSADDSSSDEMEGVEPDKEREKTSWLVWHIGHNPVLLAKVEEIFGAEWRAEVGTLLAKNSFDVERTVRILEEMDARGKRKGPDRHTMLPVVNKG